MATSPLAEIDWDNLTSAETTTAVKLLAIATQERYNIATVDKSGGMRVVSGIGTLPVSDRNKFPYKNNSPIYTLNAGDPMVDLSIDVAYLFARMIHLYADIEKWDASDTNKEDSITLYNLSLPADDPMTYSNRLFEVTGYTTYPDLSIGAPEEVKKWYDMLDACKYVVRNSGVRSNGFHNDDYLIFDGQFDPSTEGALNVNEDGAEYFGGDPTLFSGTPIADNSVYAAFKTGNDDLFGIVPTQFDESTDTGDFPPSFPFDNVYQIRAARTNDKYFSWVKSWKLTYVTDWTESIAAIGFTGKPLSYKNQCKVNHTLSSNVPSFTPVYTYPASTTADSQRYYTTNVVTRVGNIDEIAVDHLLSPITVPTNIGAFTSNNTFVVAEIEIEERNNSLQFGSSQMIEDWNGEGGFDYYTPSI